MRGKKVINFDVSEELYKKMKIKLILDDKTIKAYVTELIENDLKHDYRVPEVNK